MYTKTGNCPKCGAPIYVPTIWHGVIPPTPMYSCNCNTVNRSIYQYITEEEIKEGEPIDSPTEEDK